jgi:hypothetical protein
MLGRAVGSRRGGRAPDPPWCRRTLGRQAADRGLKELLLSTTHGRDRIARVRERLAPMADALIERAQTSGRMRPDVSGTDLPLLTMMIGAAVDFTRPVETDAWRRMLAIVIDGLRMHDELTLLGPPPLTPEQIDHAMREWKPARG